MNPGLSYRESAVAGASPVRLVILLYEQAIEDLRRAVLAVTKGDIEGRTREINHALTIIGHLQATLDKERGGQVAQTLDHFYEQLRAGLLQAQCKQSAAALQDQIAHLMQVHEAWCAVDRDLAPIQTSVKQLTENEPPGDWSA